MILRTRRSVPLQKSLQAFDVFYSVPENLDFRQTLIRIVACSSLEHLECLVHLKRRPGLTDFFVILSIPFLSSHVHTHTSSWQCYAITEIFAWTEDGRVFCWELMARLVLHHKLRIIRYCRSPRSGILQRASSVAGVRAGVWPRLSVGEIRLPYDDELNSASFLVELSAREFHDEPRDSDGRSVISSCKNKKKLQFNKIE